MRTEYIKWTLLICLIASVFVTQNVQAQRRGKEREKEPEKSETTSLRLEEESLATEGMKFMMKDEPDRALPVFQKLVQSSGNDPASHYLLATALVKLEKYDDAIVSAKKAFDLDKENIYYSQQLAELYAKRRKYPEAAEIYEKLLQKSPGNIQYGVELAAVYVFNDQFDKAIETYNVLEKSLGVTEEITHQKEQLYLRQNNLDKALGEAKKLIAAEPGEVSYLVELAEMLIANERIVEAVAPLEEALKVNPDEAQAHVLLADIYRRNGDVQKCNQELKLVFANPNLDSDPKIRVLTGYLTMLKTEAEIGEAIELAKQLYETHPNESRTNVIYADLLMRQNKKAEARDLYAKAARIDGSVFQVWGAILQLDGDLNQVDSMLVHSEKALEIFPNQGIFWYSNGTAQLAKKNFKEALSSFEESLKLIGDKPELIPVIHAQMGDAYNGLGDHEKSDAAYELSLKDNPNNDYVLNNYSYYLSLRGEKLDLALKMSAKLVQEHKDNPTYLDTHAWVLYVRKDYKKAKEFLERAMVDTSSVSGTIVEHYGDVLFKLGERDNAVAQWKKAKSMGETTELLDKKIATGALHEQ
ncbi:tetratricopeptide repeat protein [Dyadobacter psychrophilus]|uniref:Lipopolysaccharide biosynthesis regulator YciM, contains six TPR domains and a predicted metal-binding C-terminal domain n=1 Tax=Dyadobacter psychrophilus TaxID=651661 RepID=A0A1T5HFQ8_9BACT|nr:tetratricopeptide repeat protein [Dyadobacter psychrophilus]SKC19371.1 Lipopolysaccharide biosynthesis regulator YciM, contains six TPR domains and a predicted metal-binding C-terminal domain [Dyadobacter psychrophilus]